MGEWFGAFHLYYFPVFIVVLGIFAIRVLGGGEDWYDVWNEGGHHGWFSGSWNYLCFVGCCVAVAVFFGLLSAFTPQPPDPSYAESTPIKVATSKPAKPHKKNSHKKKAIAKRHVARQQLASQ